MRHFACLALRKCGGIEGGEKHIDPQLKNSGLVVVAANYRLLPKAHIDDILVRTKVCSSSIPIGYVSVSD